MSTRILAIHAHPDDLEIFAGGTLALLAERGHHITMVTLTPGDKGSDTLGQEEIAAIRRGEAAASAALIGAEYRCAELRDLEIFQTHEARARVTEILRKTRPELVLTAPPADYLCDHEAASLLVRDACFAAPAPNYLTGAEQPAPPLGAIPHLYFTDPAGGVGRDGRPVKPDFVVDVSAVFERKKRMLACHASQREWLLRQHGMDDYMLTMEQWVRERGRQAGVEYGEGFRHYLGHPYPQAPLLEELLGSELVIKH